MRKTGRLFFANPGPTNIPDSVLRAMDAQAVDFMEPAFLELYLSCIDGLKRVLRTTDGTLFMYTASGHGAWEATLANLFSPGDTLLVVESGWFSEGWAAMAAKFGLHIRTVEADWRRGADPHALTAALRADTGHAVKAVLAVHNETSTGMSLPLAEFRAAIDAAAHPALLCVDTISSLGSLPFHMDEWGIDAVVGGSQKGLMLHTGFSFTAASPRALKAHESAGISRHYFDWSAMRQRPHGSFIGTVPVSLFFGLRESLRLIEEEGLDNVTARHTRLAGATRAAVRTWAANDGPQFFCLNPERLSDSVTAITMPAGHNADAVRKTALDKLNVSFGGGLGKLGGQVLRIGHMGDLNEPMLLGTLGALELAFRMHNVPHGAGGVEAAIGALC